MNRILKTVMTILLLLHAGGSMAQTEEDFNPSNPPEPRVLYDVVTTVSHEEAGYASGTGQYERDEQVWISTSGRTEGYVFRYWIKNGEKYTENSSFYYTMEKEDVIFMAVYEYAPQSPSEPNVINKNRLYLQCSPEGCCSFNRNSGEKVLAGNYIYLDAYASQGFEFKGWYCNGEKVSDQQSFNFEMPGEATTLTAHFVFNPVNPGEPSKGEGQPSVDNGGDPYDINGDGELTIADVVALVNICLGKESEDSTMGDLNNDKVVNITDVVTLLNKCLGTAQ